MRLLAPNAQGCAVCCGPGGPATARPLIQQPVAPHRTRRCRVPLPAAAATANSAHAAGIDDSVAAAVRGAPSQPDGELAAAAVAAAQPDADAVERERLLKKAKERVAQLRAAQSATGKPGGAHAQQRSAAAAAAGSQGSDQQRGQGPEPSAATAPPPSGTAAKPSRGVVAAQSARQKAAVSASAAWAPVEGAAPAFPPKRAPRRVQRSTETVDAQRYKQVVASRNRLAGQLSGANRYVSHLEAELAGRAADVGAAAASLSQVSAQLGQLLRTAGLAAGDAADGPAAAQGYAVAQQLARLQQQVQQHMRRLQDGAVHPVPLVWVGVAQEVLLMGSFDGWSRGVALSSVGNAGDSVFHRFEGTLSTRKGEYIVKFLVDGQWRLAPHWPTRDDATGTTNNVLRID